MRNFQKDSDRLHMKEVSGRGNKTLHNDSPVKLSAIKDTWRWRSRARKNHIGMYGM